MLRLQPIAITLVLICLTTLTTDALGEGEMTRDQLEVAKFWEDMGTTLREEGIDAYARRYHEDFSHWSMDFGGKPGTKSSAVRAWSKFDSDGHQISCTFVEPVSVSLFDDLALARLVYEQTTEYSDDRVKTGVWRMVALFAREDGNWQVLATNMMQLNLEEYQVALGNPLPEGHCVK
ncbi:MAG: nuclear transport factor 2 family protein [Woeseiaceae bacterium]|nr:nuclear transport factor 2 family protein [Woeseiaceae bacterium]